MADQSSNPHVQGPVPVPPAPYDASSTAATGPWVKVETVPAGGSGHGWDTVPDGDGGPWRQT